MSTPVAEIPSPDREHAVEITWLPDAVASGDAVPTDVLGDPGDPTTPFDRYVVPELDFVERVTRRFSRNRADAEDLAQEVLTNAYRAIDRFDGRYPRAWLYRIASNAAASRARKKTPLLTLDAADEPWDGVDADEATPEESVVDPVMDAHLEQALDALPDHYRLVIDLVDLGGGSYEDAARALDLPMGTVMSRLHRGRKRLRDALAGSHLDRAGRAAVAPPV